jgi:hypothetical protein
MGGAQRSGKIKLFHRSRAVATFCKHSNELFGALKDGNLLKVYMSINSSTMTRQHTVINLL